MNQNPVKYIIKRTLQHIFARLGPHNKHSATPQLLILMYHRILPPEDARTRSEEPGMIVTPETFRLHLSILKQYFEIVHYSAWLKDKQQGKKLPDKACVITFDDGWADNHEFAFPILQEFSAPATIYLVSDMVGTDQSFWPERLANTLMSISKMPTPDWQHPTLKWLLDSDTNYPFDNTMPSREQISQIIADSKKLSDIEIHSRLDTIENTFNLQPEADKPELLDWQQVNQMIQSGLIEIGSHTCNHTRLNTGTSEQLIKDEVILSKQVIEKHTGKDVNTFCYPNGDHSPRATQLVRENYQGAVTTKSGWNTTSSDDHLLSRIAVHDDISKDRIAFLACLSGWL